MHEIDIRRQPDDEAEQAHFIISMRMILIYFGAVSVWLSLISIYISGHPHIVKPQSYINDTSYVRKNFQYSEDGNGTIFVIDPDGTRRDIPAHNTVFYTKNITLFFFGHVRQPYCKEREEGDESYQTWSTSLFRASQLYSSVQSPMRYGVLITMTPMILNGYIIAKTFFMREKESFISMLIAACYVVNEFFVYISYFLILTIHVTIDHRYIPYSSMFLSCGMMSTCLKLLIRNWMQSCLVATILRIMGIGILIISYPFLANDVQDFVETPWCDTYCSPQVTILQLLCLLVIFLNNYYDVRSSRDYFLMSSSVADEVDIQRKPRNSIFIRLKRNSQY